MPSLRLDLIVNDKGSKKISKFGTLTDATFKRTGQVATAMGAAIAASFAVAVHQTGALVKSAVLAHARYETLGVVLEQVGANAGYSAEHMHSLSKELQATGISMTESRATLVKLTQAQIDHTKATDLARIAQDAAVIGSMNSSDAFAQLIYGIQSANVRVLRTMGIMVSFEKSYKTLADQLGVTVDQLTETERATARTNAVLEAGERIAGSYEAAMGTAGKQLTSFTRYVSDFKVKMGKAFGPATTTVIKSATGIMKDLAKVIESKETQEALRENAALVKAYVEKLGGWVSANRDIIAQDITKTLKDTARALERIVKLYNSLPDGVVGAIGVGLVGRMLFGSTKVGVAIGMVALLNTQLNKVGMGLNSLQEDGDEFAGAMQKVWESISGKRDWRTGAFPTEEMPMMRSHTPGEAPMSEELFAELDKMTRGIAAFYDWRETALSDQEQRIISQQKRMFALLAENEDKREERIRELYQAKKEHFIDHELSLTASLFVALDERIRGLEAFYDWEASALSASELALQQIDLDRLAFKEDLIAQEIELEIKKAEELGEIWWQSAQQYIGFAQQMSTMGVQYLLAEKEDRSKIGKQILATAVRFLTMQVQQFLFAKAQEKVFGAAAAAAQIASSSAVAVADMSMGATRAAAWAAYYAAHAANPVGAAIYGASAAAMAGVVGIMGSAGAATATIGAAGVSAQLGQAASYAGAGVLVGALGEGLASSIEGSVTDEGGNHSYAAGGSGGVTGVVGSGIIAPVQASTRSVTVNVIVDGIIADEEAFARSIAEPLRIAIMDGA